MKAEFGFVRFTADVDQRIGAIAGQAAAVTWVAAIFSPIIDLTG